MNILFKRRYSALRFLVDPSQDGEKTRLRSLKIGSVALPGHKSKTYITDLILPVFQHVLGHLSNCGHLDRVRWRCPLLPFASNATRSIHVANSMRGMCLIILLPSTLTRSPPGFTGIDRTMSKVSSMKESLKIPSDYDRSSLVYM